MVLPDEQLYSKGQKIRMIKTLDRYIGKEFIKNFVFITGVFLIFFIIADFFDHADTFVAKNSPPYFVFIYYLLRIPGFFYQSSIFTILIATLITFTLFSRNNEIMAMRSHGLSLWETIRPVMVISIVLCLFIFIDGETLAPLTQQKSTRIYTTKIKKEKKSKFYFGNRKWLRWGDEIYNFRHFEPSGKLIAGITIFKMDRSFHVIERIDAAMARQINATDWRLSNVVWRTFEKGKPIVTFRYPRRTFKFPRLSKVSEEAEKQTKEMSYSRLKDYITSHKKETDKETLNRYYVDLYNKTAYPFGGIIMVLIAIPFALKMGRTGGISVSIGVAIGIGILYHILSSLFSSIGYAGLLNGFLAAWSANIIFILAGWLAYLSLPQ